MGTSHHRKREALREKRYETQKTEKERAGKMFSTTTLSSKLRKPAGARRARVCAAASKRLTTTSKVRVAINGFGRIGRNFLRCLEGRDQTNLHRGGERCAQRGRGHSPQGSFGR